MLGLVDCWLCRSHSMRLPGREQVPLYGRGLSESPLMEGLRGPSQGMRRLGRLAGLVEPSSSSACFNHR